MLSKWNVDNKNGNDSSYVKIYVKNSNKKIVLNANLRHNVITEHRKNTKKNKIMTGETMLFHVYSNH